MSERVTIKTNTLTDIADAIRTKTGTTDTLHVDEMANTISAISSDGTTAVNSVNGKIGTVVLTPQDIGINLSDMVKVTDFTEELNSQKEILHAQSIDELQNVNKKYILPDGHLYEYGPNGWKKTSYSLYSPEIKEAITIDFMKLQGTNCKIIAHRGLHTTASQNSLQAIEDAAVAGFKWVELDIRKCLDGIYVLAHDSELTLYQNGNAKTVTFENVNYSEIKDCTYDAIGKYNLCTLQAALVYLRKHDMKVVLDRKNGSNSEIMQIAAICGMTDSVMLSYGSPGEAINDSVLLTKYKNTPLRMIPTNYDACIEAMNMLSNPIYADVNATMDIHKKEYLNTALSSGIPIIFSGCLTSNMGIWAGVAGGCMANTDKNITLSEFANVLSANYSVPCTITVTESVSIKQGQEASIQAQSNNGGTAGYLYAYSDKPNVAKIYQTSFGQNINITVKGISAGETKIHLFTASGSFVSVPVVVEAVNNNIVWILGTVEATSCGGEAIRMCAMKEIGTVQFWMNVNHVPPGYVREDLFLPTIPAGATLLTVPEHDSSIYIAPSLFDASGTRIADPGYNVTSIDLTQYPNAKYYSANVKHYPNDVRFSFDSSAGDGYEAYLKVAAIEDFIFT